MHALWLDRVRVCGGQWILPHAQEWRTAEELLERTADGAGISGASHGNIEGGGVGGEGVGTLLSDLREAYLEARSSPAGPLALGVC